MLVSGDFQIFRWRSEKKLSHFPHLYPLYYHILQPCPVPSLGLHPCMRMNGFWGVWAAVWYSRCGVVDMVWCGVLVCGPLSAPFGGTLSSRWRLPEQFPHLFLVHDQLFCPLSTFSSTINIFVHDQFGQVVFLWKTMLYVAWFVHTRLQMCAKVKIRKCELKVET